jgi:4-hydroxy-3-methylbut-2-enyl diphosphate reductase
MDIILSEHLSYCLGVRRTLQLVDKLLEQSPEHNFYMLGEIVHNEHVIRDLKNRGLTFISDVNEIKNRGTVIIQSHGAPRQILAALEKRKIPCIDATCPMVKVIHRRIRELEADGYFPVIIGKRGHDEVRGIQGQVSRSLVVDSKEAISAKHFEGIRKIGVVVQSTFILQNTLKVLDRLKQLVPEVKFVNTICQPTTDRQDEIQQISQVFEYILIIGSKTSANTRHLYQLAQSGKSRVYLIDRPEQVDEIELPPDSRIFIASGASTPRYLIEDVIARLKKKN